MEQHPHSAEREICQTIIHCQVKMFVKNKDKIKATENKLKLREFDRNSYGLQEILKAILQAKVR